MSSLRWWRGPTALLLAACFLFPLLYMLVVSLQAEGQGLSASWRELAQEQHFENYARALAAMGNFPMLLLNTCTITLVCVLGQSLSCSLAGYTLARLEFRGRDLCFLMVLLTMMVPEQVVVVPRFLLFRTLGLVDSWYPLMLPAVLGGTPFFVFLFRQYYLALPKELDEAARVDGCGPLSAYWRIFLPLSRPMLATVAIFTFLATWNDFWNPLIYILSPEKRTLTLALAGFQQTYNTAVEHMMAASAVVLAPCVCVYFLAQRSFLRGIRVAASKQ